MALTLSREEKRVSVWMRPSFSEWRKHSFLAILSSKRPWLLGGVSCAATGGKKGGGNPVLWGKKGRPYR